MRPDEVILPVGTEVGFKADFLVGQGSFWGSEPFGSCQKRLRHLGKEHQKESKRFKNDQKA